MSNDRHDRNRPRLSLPVAPGAAPPVPSAPTLAAFPTPWCVGPYGSIWVAADVRQDAEGKWSETRDLPRCVVHAEAWDDGVAQFIVNAVNAAAGGGLPKPPC